MKPLLLTLCMLWLTSSALAQNPTKPSTLPIRKVLNLSIDSSINPATLSYLETAYKKAKSEAYDLVLIELSTPGGLVSTTKDILSLMGNSDIPTAVWVTPEGASATSAGAIIASSAHILSMSAGTNMGAATPIQLTQDIEKGDAHNKAVNDLIALVQSLSESRGRNAAAFGKMISDAASYKSQEALDQHLIDFIANDKNDFLKKIHGRSISIKGQRFIIEAQAPLLLEFEMDLGQQLLNIFANPELSYILLMLGAALIYLEFQAPGGFVAGTIGLGCLLLSGIGFQVLPLNFGALALIFLAFGIFVMEIYVTSYGLLTLAGLASLIMGSLFLFRSEDGFIHMSYAVIASVVGSILLFVLFMAFFIWKDRNPKQEKNYYSLRGKKATILEVSLEHDPDSSLHVYQVHIHGEIWKAKSKNLYKVDDVCTVIDEDQNNLTLMI